MTRNVINKELFHSYFKNKQHKLAGSIYTELINNLSDIQSDGLVELHNNENIEITLEGRFFIRIIASLVDAKLKKYLAKRENTFSKGT